MRKEIEEHLFYIAKKTTPYQRMAWLKKTFYFWKKIKNLQNKKENKNAGK